jgi:hypothetical protein
VVGREWGGQRQAIWMRICRLASQVGFVYSARLGTQFLQAKGTDNGT